MARQQPPQTLLTPEQIDLANTPLNQIATDS